MLQRQVMPEDDIQAINHRFSAGSRAWTCVARLVPGFCIRTLICCGRTWRASAFFGVLMRDTATTIGMSKRLSLLSTRLIERDSS